MSLEITPFSPVSFATAPICVSSERIDRTRLEVALTSSTTPTTPISVMTASPAEMPESEPRLIVKS